MKLFNSLQILCSKVDHVIPRTQNITKIDNYFPSAIFHPKMTNKPPHLIEKEKSKDQINQQLRRNDNENLARTSGSEEWTLTNPANIVHRPHGN